MADLLRYVVTKTLAGDEASIKAYSIAVDVFGRPQNFDPQTDPIVRVQARRLRRLLEQFYSNGHSRADVQIRLPLGRYVPEFREAEAGRVAPVVAATPVKAGVAPVAGGRKRGLSRFLFTALMGLSFTLIGVALAVAIVRWAPETLAPGAPAVPQEPGVVVGHFDNLTGDPVLDDDIGQFAARVTDLLGRFDNMHLAPEGTGPVVEGTVQIMDGRFVARAILRPAGGGGSIWTSTITAPSGMTDSEALRAAALTLAGQLGNATGPLHAPGMAWLRLQTALPEDPGAYVCELLFMSWRERRSVDDADHGVACLSRLLAEEPNNAVALASVAGLGAWRTQFLSSSDADLPMLMLETTAAASRAVELAPTSSFAHEQQAIVLSRQGSMGDAVRAARRAQELNPANMDAVSVLGTQLWLSGELAEGNAAGEMALAAIPTAPPWYYLTRGLTALREQRFFDAIDAAQALAAGDEEFGPVIALAAAPRAGRTDLIDRYRPLVMGNAAFQKNGVMPRLAMRIRQPSVLEQFRQGLVLAGVPTTALDGPFNPDGTPVVDAPGR
ncbi:MAG: hypothetical protein EOP22_10785 [Hyphomicrobiales bacterium]|nr:MAG: hypothetical protein EOP22_10785 [Hyphomicrobiales bacterium]